jgi:hypothetical protein
MKLRLKAILASLSRPVLTMVLAIALVGGVGVIAIAQTQKQPVATAVKTAVPTTQQSDNKPTSIEPTAPSTSAARVPSVTPAPSVPPSITPPVECNQVAKTRYDNDIYYPAVNAELRRHGSAKAVPLPVEPLTPEQESARRIQAAADAAEEQRHLAALQNLGDVRAQYMRSINCPLGL